MARQRKSALTTGQENYLKSQLRQGKSPNTVIQQFRSTHPNVNANQVRQAVNRASVQKTTTDRLLTADQRRVMELSEFAGCGPGRTVRLRIVVSYTDPNGNVRRFGDTIDSIPGVRGKVTDLLGGLAGQVLINALNIYPSLSAYNSISSDPNFDVRIAYAECH